MFNILFKKCKHIIITMRVGILSIFISLFIVIVVSMMLTSYFRFYSSISSVSHALMEQTSTIILREVENEIERTELLSNFSGHLIQTGVLNTKKQSDITDYTFQLVKTEVLYIQSALWADEEGNFVGSDEEKASGPFTTIVIDENQLPPIKTLFYRNENGSVYKTEKMNTDPHYDPRTRPWYVAAKNAKKTVWTDVYRYYTGLYGITAATPVYYANGVLRGVFALHIHLDYLSELIEDIKISKNGVICIVDEEGRVIALPNVVQHQHTPINIHNLSISWVVKSFDEYKKIGQSTFKFSDHDINYLATYHAIPGFSSHKWLVAVIAPEEDFIGELHKINIITAVIGFGFLIIGILLVSNLVSHLVRPLKKLTCEVEKIKNFDLDESPRIISRIKEILYISNAVYAMKQGLRSFQKYVPATLVRQLIEAGEDARIGGIKKQITIFFSDIENFTTIAEEMDPQLLIQHLCDYFAELSKIINMERGTIDKYIGDSIMAFWGAPLQEDDPCGQAAKTALLCQKKLAELNAKWELEGKPILYTRIGIHMGEAIVGNLGSSERLNYTVIGDAINIAKRLEELNKEYGTQIVVSEAVYQKIKDRFVLRLLGHVTLKGKIESGDIYELIGIK